MRTYTQNVRGTERTGTERVLHVVDGVRGFFGSILLGVVGIAAVAAGGTAGWALGAALIALGLTGIVLFAMGRS